MQRMLGDIIQSKEELEQRGIVVSDGTQVGLTKEIRHDIISSTSGTLDMCLSMQHYGDELGLPRGWFVHCYRLTTDALENYNALIRATQGCNTNPPAAHLQDYLDAIAERRTPLRDSVGAEQFQRLGIEVADGEQLSLQAALFELCHKTDWHASIFPEAQAIAKRMLVAGTGDGAKAVAAAPLVDWWEMAESSLHCVLQLYDNYRKRVDNPSATSLRCEHDAERKGAAVSRMRDSWVTRLGTALCIGKDSLEWLVLPLFAVDLYESLYRRVRVLRAKWETAFKLEQKSLLAQVPAAEAAAAAAEQALGKRKRAGAALRDVAARAAQVPEQLLKLAAAKERGVMGPMLRLTPQQALIANLRGNQLDYALPELPPGAFRELRASAQEMAPILSLPARRRIKNIAGWAVGKEDQAIGWFRSFCNAHLTI
ncbi:MAG: hypothetical protein K2X64_00525 [Rhodocyclaceae bacterium]|nr:hypothetical protein [Rhodocyclaceae bacterium]